MDLSGNKELLNRYLVAFFASRTAPPEALDLAKRWAHEIAQTDKIVISVFTLLSSELCLIFCSPMAVLLW